MCSVLKVITFFILLISIGCEKSADLCEDSVVFGYFYDCSGDGCIEIFKLDENGLAKDERDQYPGSTQAYEGQYVKVEYDGTLKMSDFLEYETALLSQTETVIGCPNCLDQGGVYIQINSEDGDKGFWFIDNWKPNVPEALHGLIDLIHEAIGEIND